jgi:pantetheine-phosphate adenylyltransferase
VTGAGGGDDDDDDDEVLKERRSPRERGRMGTSHGVLYVGVTSDEMLRGKTRAGMIASYDDRAAAALAFLRATRPPRDALDVRVGPLRANEPPLAATTERMDALVVSGETTEGGEALNVARRERGFAPVTLIAVGVIGDDGEGGKLSSSALRDAEASRGEGARGG